ncbi:M16 family metallopeptidase [Sulfurimonas sp.]|uniref:M16 family metallopeptidase n=1 Tax=Sulfurimonas sp. TaxID=2022749 RepID=UPI0035657788
MAAKVEYIKVDDLKIPVIFEKDKRLPLVNMQFVFQNSGSIEDDDKAGLAKLSASMMGEGTKKLGSSKFAEALEAKAIHISATTGRETFVIEVGSIKEEFDDALKYFDMLLGDPNLSNDALKKVKTVRLGALARKQNDFDYVASNELKSIMFKNTPLANPSSGTIDSVKSIDLKDIKSFLKEHIVSSRLIVVVGGDIALNDVKTKLKNIISKMPEGKMSELKTYNVTDKANENILKKETEQAYVYFGSPYNMKVSDDDYFKARVATFILGTGGFGSRLMEEIRVKKGLAYSAYARVNVNKSSSYFSGYLQTKIESMDDAKKTVKNVIKEFVKKGVTQDELDQTKKFLLGSEPLRVETLSQRLSRTFQHYYRGLPLDNSEIELEKIKELSLDELNKYIKEHKEILELSFAIVTK